MLVICIFNFKGRLYFLIVNLQIREQYESAWKQLQEVRNNVERLRKEHIRLTVRRPIKW